MFNRRGPRAAADQHCFAELGPFEAGRRVGTAEGAEEEDEEGKTG